VQQLFSLSLIITVVLTVFGLGLVISLRAVLLTLRRTRLVTALIAANAVVVPAIAWLVAAAFGLEETERVGLVLVVSGAGGGLALKLVQFLPGGDLPLALSLTVVLEASAAITVPGWIALVHPGTSVDGRAALSMVALLVLAPFLAGALAARTAPGLAARLAPVIGPVSTAGLVVVVATGIVAYRSQLAETTLSRTTLAGLVVAVLALVVGAAVGGAFRAHSGTTALSTGCRFSSLGLLAIDRALGGDGAVHAAAIVVALVLLVVPIVATAALRAGAARRPTVLVTTGAPPSG
jgi:predicted Na+-dependent transporter